MLGTGKRKQVPEARLSLVRTWNESSDKQALWSLVLSGQGLGASSHSHSLCVLSVHKGLRSPSYASIPRIKG